MHPTSLYSRGYLIVIVLVFGSVFFVMVSALLGFIITEHRSENTKVEKERALAVAEAGLDYYKWYLSHYPNDVTNGTATTGPYVHNYFDPEGGLIGTYSLDITGNNVCGDIASIDILSTGVSTSAPSVPRTVYGKYARPTVTEFSYIINSNVWAGADRTIIGPYHSNGGIRMDGTNNSSVSSGLEDWLCTATFGCSPNSTEDGVFGAGPNSALWSFPSPPISFAGLSVDLTNMKTKAVSAGGRYIAPSGNYGYHLIFKNNDTFDVYRVTNTENFQGYTTEAGWQFERHVIRTEVFVANYPIPPSCSLVYVEDKVWLEGVISKKVTVAAANVITVGVNPSIIIPDNITYTTNDGSVGILAIAEDSILIGLDSPNNMTIKGIFIAQNGRFGRNHYTAANTSPNSLDPYVFRNSLTVQGTIVSNGREGTKWVSGGVQTSGYTTRFNSYDRSLVSSPPPLTPYTSDTYRFIEWREMN